MDRLDGTIGQSILKFTNAVIDYSSNTLYLITPLNKLWPQIEGEWVAATGEANGRPIKIDPKKAPQLEFKDRKVYYADGDTKLTYGMHLYPDENHFQVVFFDPKKEFDEKLDYENAGLLKLNNGRLTLCFYPNPKLAKAVPKGFQTEEESDLILLEFERKKEFFCFYRL